MKWMFLLLAMIGIIIIPLVSAGIVYTGKLYTGDNFTINNETFTLRGLDSNTDFELNYTKLLLTSPLNTYAITQGQCYVTDYYTYCYLGIIYDYKDARTLAHQGYVEPKMNIQVTYTIPEITAARTTSITLDYNTAAQVTLTFKNSGLKAGKVTYTETVPAVYTVSGSDLTIASSTGAGTTLTTTVSLAAGESKTLRYSITTAQYTPVNWTGTVVYSYDTTTITQNTTPLSATTRLPYTITESYSKKSADTVAASDYTDYTLTIKNTDQKSPLHARVLVNIGQLRFIAANHWIPTDAPSMESNISITPGQSETFNLRFNAPYTGIYPITTQAAMNIHDTTFNYSSTQNYTVTLPKGIVPTIITSKTTVPLGERVNIKLLLKNMDKKNTYYRIEGTILGDAVTVPALGPGEELIAYETDYTPGANPVGTLPVLFTGFYRTESGQGTAISANATLTIPIGAVAPTHNATRITTAGNITSNQKNTTTTPATTKTTTENPSQKPSASPTAPRGFFGQLFTDIGDFFSKLFGKK